MGRERVRRLRAPISDLARNLEHACSAESLDPRPSFLRPF
jgi:hypothetical protein